MICDIAKAHGQADKLNRELLAAVLLSSAGLGGVGLVTMHGSKVVIKRASLRVFQRIVSLLAGNVTQRELKRVFVRSIPVLGPLGMAYWANVATRRIGRMADELFSREIEIAGGDDAPDAVVVGPTPPRPGPVAPAVLLRQVGEASA